MVYTEVQNRITIENAVPTSDTVGKALVDTNQVFDFTVEVHITGSQAISYEVTAEKILTGENATTLNDNDVKLYLQRGTVNGTYSDEVLLPSNFNPLTAQDTFGAGTNEMVMDSGVLNTTTTYYYRLRMWIANTYVMSGT